MPRLSLKNVSKSYGQTLALRQGNLEIAAGEVHVLIGSNGSGKSTLCKIVAGSIRPDHGDVMIDGEAVVVSGPQAARSLGIGIFYQELSLAMNRTVGENICLTNMPGSSRLFINQSTVSSKANKYISLFDGVVGEDFTVDTVVGELRSDQRQLVEIMKTLASESKILIFDEPTSALDRSQVNIFFEILRDLKKEGRSIIFISHRMDEIFEIGDIVTVIRDGETIATSPIAEINPDQVVQLMVGGLIEKPAKQNVEHHQSNQDKPTALSVGGISGPGFSDVDFDLQEGEILGFGGLHGQGQSAVLRAIFGISPPNSGVINLKGQLITFKTPRQIIQKGCAYVSGDRGRDGLYHNRSILENVIPVHVLKNHRFLASPGALNKIVRPALGALDTKFARLTNSINSLSGGNQQKVVIARWLTDPPEVLLLDDPTKGIDLAAKAELFSLIRNLAAEGMAIVLYSSEETELLSHADRILVFNNGSVTKILTGEQRTRFHLTQAAYEAA